MNVLLSIKPQFVEAMVDGKKSYELRKCVFRAGPVDRVYLYATSPVGKVVGSFRVGRIIQSEPDQLWVQIGELSGISRAEFLSYFEKRDIAYAIEIKELELFDDPFDPREVMESFTPPQSFRYVDALLHCPWPRQEPKTYRTQQATSIPLTQV